VFPGEADLELSHHYGIDKFFETGITMITVVNRAYCKKLIIVLPGQTHPAQYHKKKEETFVVLHGQVKLTKDDWVRTLERGHVDTIEPGTVHSFTSDTGCIIEEVSSTHYVDDSYYIDPAIHENKDRKTFVKHWL
jgi:quercetin dioxygenase-like cupin family protein